MDEWVDGWMSGWMNHECLHRWKSYKLSVVSLWLAEVLWSFPKRNIPRMLSGWMDGWMFE